MSLEECPLDNITVKNSPVRKQEIEFDIGYQVAKGIVEPIELEAEALVLSQGWPSFTFALEGLGFSKVSTVASFPSLTSRDEFKSTSMGKTIMDKKLLDGWLETNSDSGVIFVQGERSFLEVAFRKLENWKDLKLVFCCSDDKFWSSDGWRESHADAGGVTDGAWTCYVQNLVLPISKLAPVHRTLRHVLRTTEGGSSKRALSKRQFPPFTPGSRIIWGDKFPSVITYSVFDKQKDVERMITEEELMDMYDIELGVQADLKAFWSANKLSSSRSYVKQVPTKVLRAIGLRVVNGLRNGESISDEDSSVKSDETLIASNKDSNNWKRDDESSTGSLDDLDSIAGEIREKAACNDEEEAASEDWDIWLVNNFTSKSEKPPLVCSGNYDSELHGKLFEGLRSLLIRRYRRNVLQSFLRYLRLEYYPGKSVKLQIKGRSSPV